MIVQSQAFHNVVQMNHVCLHNFFRKSDGTALARLLPVSFQGNEFSVTVKLERFVCYVIRATKISIYLNASVAQL